jgi:osmoprotectant transport system permease protein
MTPRQQLLQVELPLAAPVIMAGVRTAAVWTIGTATLATPVGQTSLGNYIFSGLQTENWVLVLFGCAASAALALITDQLLGLIEAGAARRDLRRIGAGAAGLLAGVALALTPLISFGQPASYVVGAKNFSEQYILAELISERIEALGGEATAREDLGSAIAYRALASGELDVYVDYSGTLWANVLNRTDNPGRQAVLETLTTELAERDGVLVLGSLGFENAYALAMPRARAQALGIRTLEDLAVRAPDLTMGGDIEFFARPEWRSVADAYGLRFKSRRTFQPTFMFRAARTGEVDVISAFSSDGRIAADDLVLLEDPKGALPPYDAVVLISPERAEDARLLAAVRPLIGAIDVGAMQAANLSVDRDVDKLRPDQAARDLARAAGLE